MSAQMYQMAIAAEMAVRAVEIDDIDEWIASLKECDMPDTTTDLGRDLAALRRVFWHDGTYEDRLKVRLAAATLAFRLEFMREEEDKKNVVKSPKLLG